MKYKFDAVIIGGGAAGLLCAIAAKRKKPALNIAIIEKNDRVGKKLLSTGNGRCNLTNQNVCAQKYCGSFQKQSNAVFAKWSANKLLGYFGDLGLLTVADGEGRVYPHCRQAAAVLDVLRYGCETRGVQLFCGETVKSIKRQNGFTVTTAENVFTADKLVMATGSKAAPKLGGNNSAADYLKNLGHTFLSFSPALCPVKVQSDFSGILRSLKGLRATAEVSLWRGDKLQKSERGEVQFNEDNLSGICVFNLSLFTQPKDMISVDLLPDISERELFYFLQKNKKLFSDLSADNLLTGILQKRVAQAVMKAAGAGDFSKNCAALTEKQLMDIAHAAKALRFTVTGNDGFDRAQACKGGVSGSEIDENTMQSKRVKNLYICGEAVDLCGECGGYNLHFAFASGIIAGESL